MMCDIVIAADSAKFGQPEIKLGIVPGAGGTQRLPRAVGKAKAMDMVLTGRLMGAEEAERSGLVARVVAADALMAEAQSVATAICALGMPSVMMAKDAVNRSFETGLTEGIAYERHLFHSLFGTEDQREGLDAFLGKRKPAFTHRWRPAGRRSAPHCAGRVSNTATTLPRPSISASRWLSMRQRCTAASASR